MLTLSPASHLDHGLSPAHVKFLLERYADKDAFFLETLELPAELASLTCGLYGPLMGDAPVPEERVVYARRGIRAYNSRVTTGVMRGTRLVTVIAGPHEGKPCVLYTAYGGPLAPREPTDPELPVAQLPEAKAFWAEHALVHFDSVDRIDTKGNIREHLRSLAEPERTLCGLPLENIQKAAGNARCSRCERLSQEA